VVYLIQNQLIEVVGEEIPLPYIGNDHKH